MSPNRYTRESPHQMPKNSDAVTSPKHRRRRPPRHAVVKPSAAPPVITRHVPTTAQPRPSDGTPPSAIYAKEGYG